MSLLAGKRLKIFGTALTFLLSLFCLSYLITQMQWKGSFQVFAQVDVVLFISGVLVLHFLYIFLRTSRWYILIRQEPQVRFWELYSITAVSVSLALITPGQIGEAVRVELLKRRFDISRLSSSGVLLFEKIVDLFLVGILLLSTLPFVSSFSNTESGFEGYKIWSGVLLIVIFCALFLFFLLKIELFSFCHFDKKSLLKKIYNAVVEFRAACSSKKTMLMFLGLTAGGWLLVIVTWGMVLEMVGIPIAFYQIAFLLTLSTLSSLLSCIPGGVGVGDLIIVTILTTMNVSQVVAQAGVLALRGHAVLVIFFGFSFFIKNFAYTYKKEEVKNNEK